MHGLGWGARRATLKDRRPNLCGSVEFEIDLEMDLFADGNAAGFQNLVKVHAEILAVENTLRGDSHLESPKRAGNFSRDFGCDWNRLGHAMQGQIALNCKGVVSRLGHR